MIFVNDGSIRYAYLYTMLVKENKEKIHAIKEHFKHLFEPELLAELEEKAIIRNVKAGEIILDTGSTIRIIPIVISGAIKVLRTDEDGKEILLYYINEGETCAMTFTCCMERHPSEIKAMAEEDVEMLVLPAEVMDKWLMQYTTWKNFVMETIRQRFNELLKFIDLIAFQQLDQRLIYYLKEKSKTTGSALINLSHEQIAGDLATSRVVISRLLKKLENDKKVLLYRNQIRIMNGL